MERERPVIRFGGRVRPRGERERPVLVFREDEDDASVSSGSGERPVIELETDPDRSEAARMARFAESRELWSRVTKGK